MENREFISAANLPTTEAEEVDVLCVEGGELKRKPGASLGGRATEPDLVIRLSGYTTDNVSVVSGSVEAVAAILGEGRIPNIVFEFFKTNQAGYSDSAATVNDVYVFRYGEKVWVNFIVPGSSSPSITTVTLTMGLDGVCTQIDYKIATVS